MVFAGLFFSSLIVCAGFFLVTKRTITLKEFLAHIAISAVVAAVSSAILFYSNIMDTEVWNGKVSDKKAVEVSCEHSYSCNCVQSCSTINKSTSCTQICQTCFDHLYDVSWRVYFDFDDYITIARVDRQGLQTPLRWEQVRIGEPASQEHMYKNYMKAAPGTLFRRTGALEKYKTTVPAHPKVSDYYRYDRVLVSGGTLADKDLWEHELDNIAADLGKSTQSNVMVVVANDKPLEWYYALEEAWLGGKKNDITVVIGTAITDVTWVRVMAWAQESIFAITLQDRILEAGSLRRDVITQAIREEIKSKFKRKPMKDFEYLTASITPTVGQFVVALVINLLFSVGVGILFHDEDVFGDEHKIFP